MDVVQEWNKRVFRNIFARKELMKKLRNVQRSLELRDNPSLHSYEIDLKTAIEDILEQEELLWFQKPRSTWLANGDRNTKFFHSHILARRKQNRIIALGLKE
ncbi:hypothetical protein ES288_A05G339000v1 [Gossypium darwinii]|uniref:Uncharacterized protein n=1 Tax=Gossypium darwinii TaxID=34276 RepID=A0A5D2GNW7_GOSDA|nr:hypothetical protein ES288_A05G339000v1 [Gossypium darwinii]